jgi:protein-tyrosine phosphatase
MKSNASKKTRLTQSQALTLERLKRSYINQFTSTDSRPQMVKNKQIIDHLYLGSVGAAYNLDSLKSLKISHILTVCEELPPKYPSEFNYKIISVTDEPSTRLENYFKEATDFIKSAVTQGSNILVHCFAGVSRSSSIVIAYLIRFHGMDVEEAMAFVKKKRPWVCPNHGFYAQLKKFHRQMAERKIHR